MKIFDLQTFQKCAMINITDSVRQALRESGIPEGIVTVHCPHTTAGITINENADPDVVHDLLAAMAEIVPDLNYRHMEGNSPAHLMSTFVGSSTTVPVTRGELALGTWQGIYFCEFDGPRRRRFFVQTIGS